MPLKIVRNDITKMNTDAIVNTANDKTTVGTGCDYAIYQAAGYDELLNYRKENIGVVPEGEVFATPGFHLPCKYIFHAVSPLYIDGKSGEEEKLRSCYKNALKYAHQFHVKSIAFPLISTGGFGYPKEEGFRIAVDEISAFLMKHEMMVYVVVFDEKATQIGSNLSANLETYIDQNYVEEKNEEEYFGNWGFYRSAVDSNQEFEKIRVRERAKRENRNRFFGGTVQTGSFVTSEKKSDLKKADAYYYEHGLDEKMKHIADTFSEYLLYLIESKGMTYPEVYNRALVDKKVFSKIKNNPDYHPKKITALCLCMGAKLTLNQSRDLLARAGYALSPCDKTDIIFSYFIENGIYDMVELDIKLEEKGLKCLIPS